MKATAQSGQAMAEFLVSMVMVMSVLLLAIVMLGKFNDMRNRTLMSSRYVAWERTVWTDSDEKKNLAADPSTTEGWSSTYGNAALSVSKADDELKAEVIQRLMMADDTPISGMDRKQTPLAASQPAMWKDYGGNPLLASADDVAVGTSVAADPASAQSSAALARWSVPTADGAPFIAQLSVPTSTLQSGFVSMSVAQNSDVLKRLWPKDGELPSFSGLTFSDTNVLLSNTWVPDGAINNDKLFSQAVPAANATLVPSSGYLGLQKYAPEITTLEFGRIRRDVVPPSRLSQ
jgi:Tfp pilus assembly protein PilV